MLIVTNVNNQPSDFRLLAQNMVTYNVCGYTNEEGFAKVDDIPCGFLQRVFPYARYGEYLTESEITRFLLIESDEFHKKIEATALASQIATAGLIRADSLTKEEMEKLSAVYSDYEVSKAYKVGDIFNYGGKLFVVLQAHTSQTDWIPSEVPALYLNKMPDNVIGEWVQPTGGHDAYDKGDKVIYKGVVWTSKIDGNATIPDGDEPYNRYWSKP